MKKCIELLIISLLLFPLAGLPQNNARLAGSWTGKMAVGAVSLRLGLNFKESAGELIPTLDSPDQGAFGIKMDKATLTGDAVSVEAAALRASFEGIILPGDSLLQGKWMQGGQTYDLRLHKVNKPVVLVRPQEPKAPFPYSAQEIKFTNQKAGIELAGTLTLPEGRGPFPAVVLLSGSGPQNRNEELMGHKPFLVIADYLSRNGIAVLRYDDRGVGQSQGKFSTATTYDFADDAEAAVSFLIHQPQVDKKHVGLAGHSEGGLIAPVIAARNKEVDFIILLAGPGVDGEQILLAQSRLIMEGSGMDASEIAEKSRLNADLYHIAKGPADSATAMHMMVQAVEKAVKADSSLAESQKESGIKKLDAGLGVMTSPWMRTFLRLDPGQYLQKVQCRVLSLNGSKDLQVPCDMNQQAIEKALKKGGNKKFRMQKLEGLNHLFQHCKKGMPAEYSTLEETFAPEALQAMKDWILVP